MARSFRSHEDLSFATSEKPGRRPGLLFLFANTLHALWKPLGGTTELWGLGALALAALVYAALPWPWAAIPLLALGWLIVRSPGPGLAAIALATPFYYTQKPFGGTWLSHAEALVIAALIWTIPCRRRLRGRLCALDGAVLAFVAVGGAAAWIAPDRGDAWLALRRLILIPAGLYLLWRLLPVDRKGMRWAAGGLIAGGTLVSLIGLAGYASGNVVMAGRIPRLRSVYYSPNEAALLLVRTWPLAAALALHSAGRWRRPLLLATGVILTALALTFSRGAWLLGVPAGLAALSLLQRRRWAGPWLLGGALLAALVALSRGGSTALRPEVWQAAWAMWRDHPWLGVGLDGFQWVYPRYMALSAWREPLLYHPHNLVLELGTWMGLLGLLTVLAMGWTWAGLWRRATAAHPSPVLSGLAAGWIAGLAHGMVDAAFFLPHLAFMTMITLGMTAAYANSPEPPNGSEPGPYPHT